MTTSDLPEPAISVSGDIPNGNEPSSEAPPSPEPTGRLMSLDALRGFDMFWICGGAGLFGLLVRLVRGAGGYAFDVPPWLDHQMHHVPWEGFVAWDLIMPLFLFIVGAAMPFSFAKRMKTSSMGAMYWKIIRRTLILFVLGMIAQGHLLDFNWSTFHFFSNTLQAIAVGYFVASILLLHTNWKVQLLVTVLLLLAFWGVMAWIPAPGQPAGSLDAETNIAIYIDRTVFGSLDDETTYTWLLSSLTFPASVLLGVFAGQMLRQSWGEYGKFFALLGAGVACLALAWIWSYYFPIIKHLWTSSMVLWAGGLSYVLLAFFYLVIDVWKIRAWAFPFVVIGANAIFAYVVPHVINLKGIANSLVGGAASHAPEPLRDWIVAATAFLLLWFVLLYLYRKRTFIRI